MRHDARNRPAVRLESAEVRRLNLLNDLAMALLNPSLRRVTVFDGDLDTVLLEEVDSSMNLDIGVGLATPDGRPCLVADTSASGVQLVDDTPFSDIEREARLYVFDLCRRDARDAVNRIYVLDRTGRSTRLDDAVRAKAGADDMVLVEWEYRHLEGLRDDVVYRPPTLTGLSGEVLVALGSSLSRAPDPAVLR